MLRDHPLLRAPLALGRFPTARRAWPSAWGEAPDDRGIEVLPLVDGAADPSRPGWCTYAEDMAESPEVEVVCGGINSKTPSAAAVWRQGNLLHFGFEPDPDEMNEAGRALLVDAIAYIARFTEDRPIMRTPSPFAGREFLTRARIGRWMNKGDPAYWGLLKSAFDRTTLDAAGVRTIEDFRAWFRRVRDVLRPDREGLLTVDAEARAAGLVPGRPEFFDRAVAALAAAGADSARARLLLARYAPEGPGEHAQAPEWAAWWRSHRDYLFFGEVGGYRWYLDPRARRRGVPTARLRGQARASR